MKTLLKTIIGSHVFLVLVILANAMTPGSPDPDTTGVDPDAVVLSWTPGISEEEAKVFLSPFVKPNSYDLALDVRSSAAGGVVSGAFSSLRPNTVYYWRVDGLDADGEKLSSGTPRAFTTGSPDPLKPVLIYPSPTPMPSPLPRDPDDKINLTMDPVSPGKLNNILVWSGTHPKASYNVYFGKHLDKGGPEFRGNVAPTASGTCTFSLGQLEANMHYFCRADLVESEFGTVVKTGRMWDFWTGTLPEGGVSDPDTVLFADAFENTPATGNPASRTEIPDLGWERKDSSVQTRNAGNIGERCVKLGGATWFSNSVSTLGMKDIRIRFFGKTSENQTLLLKWSVDGTNWRPGGTVPPNTKYEDGPQEFSVANNFAANQPDLIFHFLTSNPATNEYAYIDGVQVLGRVHHFPAPPGDGPRIGEGVKSVIFLGDSLTSNSGPDEVGDVDHHWTGVINERFDLGLDVIIEDKDALGNPITPVRHDNLGKGGSIATKYKNLNPAAPLSELPSIKADDDSSSGGLERLRVELKYRADHPATDPMPKFVIINFGTNDHKLYAVPAHEGEPVVAPTATKSSAEVFGDNLKVIINLVRSVGAKPILVIPHDFVEGPVPGGNVNTATVNDYLDTYYSKFAPRLFGDLPYYGAEKYVTPSGDGGALRRFHNFINQIRQIADADLALDVIDINTKALEYDAQEFTIDGGVHLSPLGHQVYAETIGDYLEDRYGGSPSP